MTAKEAVGAFIDAANDLRGQEAVEIGYALLDAMKIEPIRTSYAIYGVMSLYEGHIAARLPEERAE